MSSGYTAAETKAAGAERATHTEWTQKSTKSGRVIMYSTRHFSKLHITAKRWSEIKTGSSSSREQWERFDVSLAEVNTYCQFLSSRWLIQSSPWKRQVSEYLEPEHTLYWSAGELLVFNEEWCKSMHPYMHTALCFWTQKYMCMFSDMSHLWFLPHCGFFVHF